MRCYQSLTFPRISLFLSCLTTSATFFRVSVTHPHPTYRHAHSMILFFPLGIYLSSWIPVFLNTVTQQSDSKECHKDLCWFQFICNYRPWHRWLPSYVSYYLRPCHIVYLVKTFDRYLHNQQCLLFLFDFFPLVLSATSVLIAYYYYYYIM